MLTGRTDFCGENRDNTKRFRFSVLKANQPTRLSSACFFNKPHSIILTI